MWHNKYRWFFNLHRKRLFTGRRPPFLKSLENNNKQGSWTLELESKKKAREELLAVRVTPLLEGAIKAEALVPNSSNSPEPKQPEAALQQENTEWESIFNSLTDAVTIHDKNFDLVRANASARQLLGLPFSGKLFDTKCFKCYHGTEEPPVACPSCHSLVTERPSVAEFFESNLNKYLEIRDISRFDANHQCIGLVHIVRDITEQKRIEAEKEGLHYATPFFLTKLL